MLSDHNFYNLEGFGVVGPHIFQTPGQTVVPIHWGYALVKLLVRVIQSFRKTWFVPALDETGPKKALVSGFLRILLWS